MAQRSFGKTSTVVFLSGRRTRRYSFRHSHCKNYNTPHAPSSSGKKGKNKIFAASARLLPWFCGFGFRFAACAAAIAKFLARFFYLLQRSRFRFVHSVVVHIFENLELVVRRFVHGRRHEVAKFGAVYFAKSGAVFGYQAFVRGEYVAGDIVIVKRAFASRFRAFVCRLLFTLFYGFATACGRRAPAFCRG